MPLIILDGPEKAGKTTLANAIVRKYGGVVRHWGAVESDDRAYLEPLVEDVATAAAGGLVVWDRGWAAEHVYAVLLGRDRRLRGNPWLGEWLYGRAFISLGMRVMVLGLSVESNARLRDDTDLPVDPRVERELFETYARRFGWWAVVNSHDTETVGYLANTIYNKAALTASNLVVAPPLYAGPADARLIVVGEARNEGSKFPGAWLPFTTPMTMEFAQLVPGALNAGWVNAADCPPQALRGAHTIIACGHAAGKWAEFHVGHAPKNIVRVAHPAYAMRFNNAAGQIAKRDMLQKLATLTAAHRSWKKESTM